MVTNKGEITIIGVRKLDGQGGMERHVREVSVRLSRRGWRVGVLESCAHPTSLPGVNTCGIVPCHIPPLEKIVYNLRCALMVREQRPKLLYVAGLNGGLLIWFFRLCGVKVVARLASLDFLYPKFGWLERVVLRWCLLNYRLAERVVVVNDHYLNYLAPLVRRGKVRVIPNGTVTVTSPSADHDFLSKHGVSHKKFVLSVGRITPEKNYLTLIQGFLQTAAPEYSLVIAGGSSADDDSQAAGSMEMASGRVRLLGEIPPELMQYLYVSCACYVNASLFEGQSNAVLEAISYEIPVLLSDIPGNRSVGLPDNHYFPVHDSDQLSEKIAEALVTPEKFIAPRSVVASFDWEVICDRLEATLLEAMHE